MAMASPSPFSVLAEINETKTGKNRICSAIYINDKVLTFAFLTMFFCLLGMLGNGLLIWLLGPSVKRNTFAFYIINLSVADFGFLTFELIIEIHGLVTRFFCGFPYELFQAGLLLMYSTGQFLLTVISVDRCLSVLFPIWYRCHRPTDIFTSVCAVTWVISFTFSSIYLTITIFDGFQTETVIVYPFLFNAVLCLPLMTISSVTLFIKICFVSKRQRRRKLLTVILVTLFFFLVLAFPLNAFYLIWRMTASKKFVHYGYLFASINSSMNPLIYCLVGRPKGITQRSIKDLLQKMFKDEEDSTDNVETSEGSRI